MLEIALITAAFIFVGSLGLWGALLLAGYWMKHPPSIRSLVVDLKPKLCMTVGLGIFFFTLYACLVLIFSFFLNTEIKQTLFSLALRHPIYFIYGGLTLFVTLSLTILIVRSFIKKVYNSRQ
ncbi:MAG: hypothetical protein ACXU9U_01410 [Parachlamydiaceae bacterium]